MSDKRLDHDLVSKVQRGDKKAFDLLVLKYQQIVANIISRYIKDPHETLDVTQEAFIKAYRALPNFRGDSAFYTWLYRIATNEALTFLKQKKKRNFAPWVDVEQQISESLESDPWFNGDEAQLKLQKAILKLPEKQRIVFNMKYFDQVKYEDMSKILDTSVGALKASYHHAVKKIEAMLGDD